ncbi:hypothetical protein WICMUC_002446 [Wickerhamomyces mucosus]|uniref:Transcription factor Iwr1 domain-containing protein n=1 Tax=Wickerhamomyces mucosus TaxID=1378264 RepID=A0A9P8TEX9_9ASCO|nr:hypothetical protein WICMUC_002446 [Wickerhamomyces mucosus]
MIVLDGSRNKRLKTDFHFFKLQRTEDQIERIEADGSGFLPLLHESNDKANTFIIPKTKEEGEQLPHHFTDMLDSVLDLSKTVEGIGANSLQKNDLNLKKRKRIMPSIKSRSDIPEKQAELDYVYDVYYRDKEIHEYNKDNNTNIGFLKFEQDLNELLDDDNGSGSDLAKYSDDEDSNAEDFYRNDYPEGDEDGNESDEDDNADSEDNGDNEILKNQIKHELEVGDQFEQNEYDDLYDQFFEGNGSGPADFLHDEILTQDEDEDEHDLEPHNGESFSRNKFFESDEHDPLAVHRDRIFGKLQRMINEQN